ncbi:inorganic diphosphatase IPP1 [Sugiyamaella lignohabitans]|uniref:inorganic diphosphatase n=1 Tax=Sugiyamaella lignohabitans TaxID=796027 RepID=A0A167DSV6_9ASCO|nr:inorganic diphosphatase IPP1 [Sugiyamaella lignohabitans]ANB13254.1 inorganic diphosphatase IPP1 [Sugiyamaella lignohabitans]
MPFQMSRLSSSFTARLVGEPDSASYRAYLQDSDGNPLSAIHDIPYKANEGKENGVYNMIVEVPRWTNAKLEISRSEELNPILQDTKKGKLRYVANVFPYKGYIHNYGAIPQTWEDPKHIDPETKTAGDCDPIDVCEIGESIGYTGQVKEVKVLGCMPLIDEGETDWKVLAISVDDPLSQHLNDIEDIEKYCPGLLDATTSWFRNYKVPDGKDKNTVGAVKNRTDTIRIIEECHGAWKGLIKREDNQFGINE